MPLNLNEIISFFVEFESVLTAEVPPGVMENRPRSVPSLLQGFSLYFGGPINVLGMDFYEGVGPQPAAEGVVDGKLRKDELGSLVLYYGKEGVPTSADILVNLGEKADGTPAFNRCYRRFLVMKEAFHAVLKVEFERKGKNHPDTAETGRWLKLAEKLVYLPFSLPDFDDPEYDDDLKIEHAAELLAIFILYPLDHIAADRKAFLAEGNPGKDGDDFEDPEVIMALTLPYATNHRVPQRYVDLLFRWKQFEHVHLLYQQLKDGYRKR